MYAMVLLILSFFTVFAAAQQAATNPEANRSKTSIEPKLPVIYKNACPFEGCIFRKWTVTAQSKVYSSFEGRRTEMNILKVGEKVDGVTGVLIIRKPDKFIAKESIPSFSLEAGDAVYQYAEWGEGSSDLWAKGIWWRDFEWGAEQDDQPALSEENLQLVERGVKEWWVQIRKSNSQIGWVLFRNNFSGMDQLGDPPPRTVKSQLQLKQK